MKSVPAAKLRRLRAHAREAAEGRADRRAVSALTRSTSAKAAEPPVAGSPGWHERVDLRQQLMVAFNLSAIEADRGIALLDRGDDGSAYRQWLSAQVERRRATAMAAPPYSTGIRAKDRPSSPPDGW